MRGAGRRVGAAAVESGRAATLTLVDLAAPAVLTLSSAHELLYNHSSPLAWLLALTLIWPLLWRRRAPLFVLGICLSVAGLLWFTRQPSIADASLLVALYTVAAHRDTRQAVAAAVALEAAVLLVAFRFAPRGSIDDATILLTGLAASALLLGTTVRAQRSHLAALEDRASRLEREQAQQAELAAAAERTRIAREMHDIVAHGLAVVIALAEGAAAEAETDAVAARQAMRQVAVAGRRSLAEMRRLLEVLRTEPVVERQPHPGFATLESLVDLARSTGLAVRLVRVGDLETVAETVQATVYRVLQEALTNVVKHAPAATAATVSLVRHPAGVRFEVENDGGPVQPAGGSSRGRGLVGMRERVALFGGRVTAGPTAAGWSVRGELPLG